MRNAWIDPATGEEYVWTANHHTEEVNGRTRLITQRQPVAAGWQDVRPILQQGAVTPRRIRLRGVAPDDEQHAAAFRFLRLSKTQTVLFRHCVTGETYEVLVTSYEPQRVAVARGPRGGDHKWDYSLELEVI